MQTLADNGSVALPFVKMHGIGNDYVYLDAVRDRSIEEMTERHGWPALVSRIAHRHTGIGSDGVILVCPARDAANHCRMRMFNADGSESEMCGNGVRCVAKFAHDRLGMHASPLRVETGRGVLSITYTTELERLSAATVNMGPPEFDLQKIPVNREHLQRLGSLSTDAVEWGLPIDGLAWVVSFVSMGNPHAVAFVESVDAVDLARIGPKAERHPAFPQRVNFHVAQVVSRAEVRMRTWERGSGITQACGTGACAVFAAGVRTGRLEPHAVLVQLPGGDLRLSYGGTGVPAVHSSASGDILMTGPAEEVCEGVYLGRMLDE